MNVKQRIADVLRNECYKAEHDYVNAMVSWNTAVLEGSRVKHSSDLLENRRQVYRDYQEAYAAYVQEALAD